MKSAGERARARKLLRARPKGRAARISRVLDMIDWLEKNDPARFTAAMKSLAQIVVTDKSRAA